MDTRCLTASEFQATMTPKMHDVTALEEAVLDIWPYVDAIPTEDLQGYQFLDVEYVYRSGDERFDHVLLATHEKNVNLAIVVDLTKKEVYGHHILDLNQLYGLRPQAESKEDHSEGFVCGTCGKRHAELPMNFGADAPDAYYSVPAEERSERCDLTSDLCVIDEGEFFIRGCLEIPVIDGTSPFVWGVWVSLSKENFKRAVVAWESPERQNEPPYFGWLCTSLSLYPDTLLLKTHVHTRPIGQRPLIELEPTDHPLAVDQREGISMNRVRSIAEALLHGKQAG